MKSVLRVFFVLLLTSVFISCAAVRGKDILYKTSERFDPYDGNVKIYWKEHGVPADPNSYTVIATIRAQSFWAGIREGKFNKKVHQFIIQKTAEIGGNGVIIYCGEIGSVGQAVCYGDVIRIKKEKSM